MRHAVQPLVCCDSTASQMLMLCRHTAYDDDTLALVHRLMKERGVSFKKALNDAICEGAQRRPKSPSPTVNLDRALQVAADLEDEELIRRQPSRRMKIVDANVLLYAVNSAAEYHSQPGLARRCTIGWRYPRLGVGSAARLHPADH